MLRMSLHYEIDLTKIPGCFVLCVLVALRLLGRAAEKVTGLSHLFLNDAPAANYV